jgi:hypothetical protein
MKRTLLTFLLVFVFVLPVFCLAVNETVAPVLIENNETIEPVLIDDENDEPIEEEVFDDGITPDSPLYFLDVFLDKVGYYLTFSDEYRALYAARIANERLEEIEFLNENGKIDLIENVKGDHEFFIVVLEEHMGNIPEGNVDYKIMSKIETMIEKHEMKFNKIENDISLLAKENENLRQLVSEMSEKINNLEISIWERAEKEYSAHGVTKQEAKEAAKADSIVNNYYETIQNDTFPGNECGNDGNGQGVSGNDCGNAGQGVGNYGNNTSNDGSSGGSSSGSGSSGGSSSSGGITTCIDTDGGQVIGTLGTCGGNTDVCVNPERVREYYCSGSSCLSEDFACGTGLTCLDGACVIDTTDTSEYFCQRNESQVWGCQVYNSLGSSGCEQKTVYTYAYPSGTKCVWYDECEDPWFSNTIVCYELSTEEKCTTQPSCDWITNATIDDTPDNTTNQTDTNVTDNTTTLNPSITITQPNGGETLSVNYTIKWTYEDIDSFCDVQVRYCLSPEGCSDDYLIGTTDISNGQYDWNVRALQNTTGYSAYIYTDDNKPGCGNLTSSVYDTSDGNFNITN